jgi:hypothetical protein
VLCSSEDTLFKRVLGIQGEHMSAIRTAQIYIAPIRLIVRSFEERNRVSDYHARFQ